MFASPLTTVAQSPSRPWGSVLPSLFLHNKAGLERAKNSVSSTHRPSLSAFYWENLQQCLLSQFHWVPGDKPLWPWLVGYSHQSPSMELQRFLCTVAVSLSPSLLASVSFSRHGKSWNQTRTCAWPTSIPGAHVLGVLAAWHGAPRQGRTDEWVVKPSISLLRLISLVPNLLLN